MHFKLVWFHFDSAVNCMKLACLSVAGRLIGVIMVIATSEGADASQSASSNPLQSLLSHLPSLSTTVSSSHTNDLQATTAQASRPASISSVQTAITKEPEEEHNVSRAPSPITPVTSSWTIFHFAHPPPKSRTHGRRRHSYPPLLLQLRRNRPGGRIPRPDLEVYPIVGSIRKEKRAKPVTCGSHELSKEDLIVLRYSIEDDSNTDFPPLGIDTAALGCEGIVSVLHHCVCSGQSTTPHDVIFVDRTLWVAAPHPDGGYAFISQTDAGTKRVSWIPQREAKRSGRASTNPLPATNLSRSDSLSASKFAFFSTASGVESRTDGCCAQLDMNAIHVRELQDSETSKVELGFDQSRLTALAVATGLWVANREGWIDLGFHSGEGSAIASSADDKSEDSRKTSSSARVSKLVHRRRLSE